MRDVAVCLVAALVSVGVAAQPEPPQEISGFYAGAGVGSTEPASYNNDYWYSDVESGSSATSATLFAGYRVNRYVAVEAAYLDAGDVGWRESLVYVPDFLGVYNTDIDLDVSATQVSVSGILPFANIWEGYLRGGVAFWEADGTQQFTPSFGGPVVRRSVSDSGSGFLFGIGGRVRLLPQLPQLGSGLDVDEDLFAIDDDSGTMDTFLLALQYRFGGSR
jgi:hypothetical protein